MKKTVFGLMTALALTTSPVNADDFVIDTKGMHAFVQFRVKHLGYSWIYGRFNDFSGEFSYDADNPDANRVSIEIDMSSVDTNHAERDKHIRSDDFLDTDKYPTARFVSHSYKPNGDNSAEMTGELTLFGTTKPVTLDVTPIGGGNDPWGGYRQGFEGSATLKPADFGLGIAQKLGPAAAEVELILSVEGVRK